MTDHAIAGPATISPGIFQSALLHRKSPATDSAAVLYRIALAWGVNPAVALGFFVNESSAGTAGTAVKTRNWGNLRMGPGELGQAGGFATYADWTVSLNDWCKLLRGPLYEGAGLLTVSQVTPKYAPSDDANDPVRYAAVVNFLVQEWATLSGGEA